MLWECLIVGKMILTMELTTIQMEIDPYQMWQPLWIRCVLFGEAVSVLNVQGRLISIPKADASMLIHYARNSISKKGNASTVILDIRSLKASARTYLK